MGPGGAGKSNEIFVLADELVKGGYGYTVITAFNGVAAAQFLEPTLLKLFGFGRKN